MTPPKRVLLAVAVAAVVVTAGCGAGPLSENAERQLADRVTAELDDVDSYEATVTAEVVVDGETRSTLRRHVQADVEAGSVRSEILAPTDSRGDTVVSNGATTWRYDASENTATRYENAGDSAATANVTAMFRDAADQFNVSVNGTERVAGTEAYVAELTPTDRDTGAMTVWLNTSTYFPVRVHQTFTVDGTTYETTTTYENVTLNPDFEAGHFDYEPPENVTVETTELPESEQADSLSALRNATDRTVAEPELPDDFSFDQGSVVTNDGETTVMASYANDTATVQISQRAASGDKLDGEPIAVDGRNATLTTLGDTVTVAWTCDGTRHTVTSDASESLARSVAASVDC